MKKLEWVTNAVRPCDWRPEMITTINSDGSLGTEQTKLSEYVAWYTQFHVGEPVAPHPDKVSLEEIRKMGLVGLYREVEEDPVPIIVGGHRDSG